MVRLVAFEASGCDIRNSNGEGEARVPDLQVTEARGVAHILGMSPHPPALVPLRGHRGAMPVRRPAEEPA
jgi:hypothetical protein